VQRFGCPKEGGQFGLLDVDHPGVHESHQGFEVRELHVPHEDDRMFARIVLEKFFEVGAARRQHHLVRFDALPAGR